MSPEHLIARFPRAAATLEATRVAEAFRDGAAQLDEIAANAHRYETSTLRRLVRATMLETVQAAVDAEGAAGGVSDD